MPDSRVPTLWYKDAIIYELHVKAFRDSNGDGRGDFRGLIEKLDYLQDLGVTAVWLLPFYPSPQRDDGYDISDYRGIHPDYGTLRDFRAFVREAHRRELKVITELVVNHTSDQHPWFQAARRARPGSARREYYVWSDTDKKFPETRIIFTDTESSNWAWDSVAKAYYWHRFFSHQPDLNHNNPRVVAAVGRVLRFWLEAGVDGLRLDAVPYLCVREGTNNENLPETHQAIKQLRRIVDQHFDDRMLLAEANQWPTDVREYFGDGDECHMAFHFPLMPRIYMALRQEDRLPITDILRNTPEIPPSCQWALFLRNHDELTLEMVTDEERDYMYREYARDPRMRVNVGIRRRLAPLVDNGRRRMELLNSLLFSFPGTPIIYYGDEIGMGDNIYLGDRDGVRTPMQWTADRNAGFSQADPGRLYLPVIMDAVYGYQAVNVEAQQRSPSSLLQFMRRLIALRRQHKAFGRGSIEFLTPRNRKILAYLRQYRGEVVLCVANLSRFVQPAELDLSRFRGWTPVEMVGRTEFPPIGDLPYFLTLGPHAFFWFQLEPQARPIRVSSALGVDTVDLPSLTVAEGYDQVFDPEYRLALLEHVVAPFLLRQRWYQGKARDAVGLELEDAVKLGAGFYLMLVRSNYADGGSDTYSLPLKATRGGPAEQVAADAPASVMARIRTADGEGVLYDALADQQCCATLFAAMSDGRRYATIAGHTVRASSVAALVGSGVELTSARRLSAEQSNTSVVLNDEFIFKYFRRIERGPNPDLEIGRFLTERTTFDRIAPVAGGLDYVTSAGATTTLGMLQRFVPNQGDGWELFCRLLEQFLDTVRGRELPVPPSGRHRLRVDAAAPSPPEGVAQGVEPARAAARLLGRRTAEFHLALASDRRDGEFAPRPITADHLRETADEFSRHAQAVLELLGSRARSLPEPAARAAEDVLSSGSLLLQRYQAIEQLSISAERIRCHGDYHLGQVLQVGDDFILLDFEGEPLRTLEQRRRKVSPLRDVAGMLRSFGYAAGSVALGAARRTAPAESGFEHWLSAWEDWVAGAFLASWLDAMRGSSLVPDSAAALQALLEAFVLNKAFYEVEYELNNRPDWVSIPLLGIAAIAGLDSSPEGR